jgi:ATP synthase protein I
MAELDPPTEAERLEALRRKVDAARSERAAKEQAAEPPPTAANLGLRIGGEFGAAILVGAGIGYGVDVLFQTKPWGLAVGLGFGFAAAIVSVVRAVRSYNGAHPADANAAPVVDDEDGT